MYSAKINWLFDLDETLHQAGSTLFPLISEQMTCYIMDHLDLSRDQANSLRIRYWQHYGATLTGLQRHHRINPAGFLNSTHDMETLLPLIRKDHRLPSLLRKLPGRKWIFSNGPQHYAEAIVDHLALQPYIEKVFAFEHLPKAKPHPQAYKTVLRELGLAAKSCIMIEDSAANLRTAKQLGMKTVWLSREFVSYPWIDYQIRNIGELRRIR